MSVTGASADDDAAMLAEPLLEDWAGAGTHDAAFTWNGADYELLTAGNFLWRVLLDGAVCAIDLSSGTLEQVVDGDALDIQIETMIAHPQVDDAFSTADSRQPGRAAGPETAWPIWWWSAPTSTPSGTRTESWGYSTATGSWSS